MKGVISSKILRTIPLLITISLLSFPAYAKYSGGMGEPKDPYRIATAEDLMLLGGIPEDYDKHFILTADIDLDPNLPDRKVFDKAVIAPDLNPFYSWPFKGTSFTGVFDGNGHTVSHLKIIGNDFLGLFGQIGSGAKVSNLCMEAVDVNGTGDYIGGLCGKNSGTISNCYATGSVTGGNDSEGLGGLVGENSWGTISNCYATGSVTGGDFSRSLGGLCGVNGSDGTISNCYSTGSVTSGDHSAYLGGLCGDNWGTITVCYVTASIIGGDNSVTLGGLCGGNIGTISNCFWDKQMCGTLYSSGGWGMNTTDMMNESTYIGWNNGAWVIDEGRDYPHLAWENTPGAIIDYEHPRNYPGNGEDQPFELERPEDIVCISLRPDDWDKNFVLTSDIDMSSVIDYRPVGLFTGSFDGQDHIVENLTIDANVIGNNNQLGLFGRIGLGGQVANLGLLDLTVIAPSLSLFLGGLCGQNDGTISNCYATGSMSDGHSLGGLCGSNSGTISNCHSIVNVSDRVDYWSTYIGGLCGLNERGGTISNCYATGNVICLNLSLFLGGLCGQNDGTISNCYATGSVTGGDHSAYLGGLCGYNWGTISDCYATGSMTGGILGMGGLCGENYSDVIACFWDIETSGQATSAGGIGKTTAEMQTVSTFLEAGWDFVDETDNGTEDIWWILEGQDYPRLWWELIPEN